MLKQLLISVFSLQLLLLQPQSAMAKADVPNISLNDGQTKTIQAMINIDAPPAYVWQTITNYSQLKSVMPGYQKSEVIERNGNQKTLDISLKVTKLLPAYNYRARICENKEEYKLNIQRISGDFKSLSANYKLIPKNGGKQTTVIYQLAIDPGSNLPGSGSILKGNTAKSITAMQAHIESSYQKTLISQR